MSTQLELKQEKEIPTLYLIDGSAYIYRAYHAVRPLSNRAGTPTNAVFGYTSMLLKATTRWEIPCIVSMNEAASA